MRTSPLLLSLAGGAWAVLLACFAPAIRRRIRAVFEHPRPPSSGATDPALDGLRGIAILMVVGFHVFQWLNEAFSSLGACALVRNGFAGVELFVALSGQLIYGTLRDRPLRGAVIRAYAGRRARRILPAYLAATLVCALLAAVLQSPFDWQRALLDDASHPPEAIRLLLRELTLLRTFDWSIPSVLDPPTWSLAPEVAFYLGVPCYVAISRRWAAGSALIGLVVLLAVRSAGPRELALVPFFWVGIAAFELERSARIDRALSRAPLLAPLVSGVCLALYFSQPLVDGAGHHLVDRQHGSATLALGLLSGMLAVPRARALRRALSCYPLRFVGLVSYGLFVWHFPVLFLSGLDALPPLSGPAAAVVFLGVVLPACLGVAALSFVCLERPFLRARR